MAIMDSASFPSLIFELLKGGDYSIGLHGIDPRRARDLAHMTNMGEVADKIREEGLTVYSARTINGTVAFTGRIDDKADVEKVSHELRHYRYGSSNKYVIVAVPVVFRDAHGNQIYGGKNNKETEFKRYLDTTGYELTCVSDIVILGTGDKIPPEYILGTYELLPNGQIDFELNEKHMSQNGGVLSDEEFARISKNLKDSLFGLERLTELLTKKNLTEEDYARLDSYYFVYSTLMGNKNNPNLPGITETIKQIIDERNITHAKAEDYDAANKKETGIDYKAKYEGLSGEELFVEQLKTIYDGHLEYFTVGGKDTVTSDRPGELEEIKRILNDEEFLKTLFELNDRAMINRLTPLMTFLSSDEVLKRPEVYLGIFRNDLYAARMYGDRGLLSKEMLMDVASKSSFTKDTIYYLGEHNDDLEVVLAFIDNSTFENFPFYDDLGPNNIAIKKLGDSVKGNPEIYERMNKKIQEFNEKNNAGYELFDVEERVKEAKGSSI